MALRLLGTQTVSGNNFTIGGVAVNDLASEFGTPLYVVDEAHFRNRIREFFKAARAVHSNVALAFASKSNGALEVLRTARDEGMDVDVASEGELYGALKAGFEPKQIHVHGNNKSQRELEWAVELDVGAVIVDNFREIKTLGSIGKPCRVILRLAPNVDPHTHVAIRTGQADTKFGFNIYDGSAAEAINLVANSQNLHLIGFHTHVGSQLLDSSAQIEGAELVSQVAIDYGRPIEEISVGGGRGIPYLPTQEVEPIQDYCRRVIESALRPFMEANLPLPKVSFEPGRSVIGEAGSTLYTAGVLKSVTLATGGTRRYLSIDGGVADNPRPLLYDAVYSALNVSRPNEPHDTEFCLSSRHCESDTMIQAAMLPDSTAEGDLILVQCTGAYGFSMASNYNRYPRPAMVFAQDGKARVVVRRESLEDLFQTE